MSTTTPTFPRSSIPQWEAKHEHNHAGHTMTARRDLEHNLPLLHRALAVQSAGGSLSDFARQMGVSKSAIYVAINKARKTGRLK